MTAHAIASQGKVSSPKHPSPPANPWASASRNSVAVFSVVNNLGPLQNQSPPRNNETGPDLSPHPFGDEVQPMSPNSVLASAVFCVALGLLAAYPSPAEQLATDSKEQKLTPEGAKEALLKMMRSKPGKDLGWFNGDIPDEMAKMKIDQEKDGWYAWTGAFRFNPAKAIYTFVVRPQPGFKGSIFEYEGSFVTKDGSWSATPPKLVRKVLQAGE
jgi:hypothetical protein